MTINKFDRTNLRSLRSDMDAALAEVSAKHGITFKVGTMRFNPEEVKLTLVASIATTNEEKGAKIAGEMADLDAMSSRHNLPANLMGRSICVMGRSFTIMGVKLSRPKYPFIVTGAKGGRYKMSVADIRNGLDPMVA